LKWVNIKTTKTNPKKTPPSKIQKKHKFSKNNCQIEPKKNTLKGKIAKDRRSSTAVNENKPAVLVSPS